MQFTKFFVLRELQRERVELSISRRKTIVVDILDVVMNISGLAAITAQR